MFNQVQPKKKNKIKKKIAFFKKMNNISKQNHRVVKKKNPAK